MIRSQITNGESKLAADVDSDDGKEDAALVVATRELKTYENISIYFTSPDYGVDMNVDASFGGTSEGVHDGTDTALWAGSEITGKKVTFDSGDAGRFTNGTKSIKVDNPALNDIWQFDKGSDLTVSDYVALTFNINIDKDWANDTVEIYGWDTGVGAQVGNSVAIEDYVDTGIFDTSHTATIPLSDMGLTTGTIDVVRMQLTDKDGGKAPKFYLDEIQFEETGTPAIFTVEPEAGSWSHIKTLKISLADAMAGTLANGTMPALPYDALLGETLTTGVSYKREHDGEIAFSISLSSLMDFLQFPDTCIVDAGSDGTNTWVTLEVTLTEPVVLKPESGDKLSFTINEDLTGLLLFRITAGGKKETRG